MNNQHNKGMTLIEVMIVVVIVGIIASFAYPAYQDSVIRTNRTAAAGCLLELSQFMERLYTQNMTYTPDPAVALPALTCRNDLVGRYTFNFGNRDERAYTLTAQPTLQQNDTECGVLTLDQTGTKGALNGAAGLAVVRQCW